MAQAIPSYIDPETTNLWSNCIRLCDQGKLEQAEHLVDQLCDREEMARRYATNSFTSDYQSGMEVQFLYLDSCWRNAANLYSRIGCQYTLNSSSISNAISQATRCFEKSIVNAKRSKELFENHDSDHLLAVAYGNLGAIYHVQKQFGKATEYLEQCIACSPTVQDQRLQDVLNCQNEARKLLAQIGKPVKQSGTLWPQTKSK